MNCECFPAPPSMKCFEVPFAVKLKEPRPKLTIEDFVSSLVDQVTTIFDVDSKGIQCREFIKMKVDFKI